MRLLLVLATLASLIAAPVAAQPVLRVHDVVEGDLASTDSALQDGSRYDTYRFLAKPGHVYYLYLFGNFEGWLDVGRQLGSGCGAVCARAEDDDEPGSTVAMQFVPERPGIHLVRAGAVPGATGGYRIALEEQEVHESVADSLWPGADTLAADPLPDLADAQPAGLPPLIAGEPREGFLDTARADVNGRTFGSWRYVGQAEETITVTMESDAFDTMLRVLMEGDAGWQQLAFDDDGGEGSNSAVTVRLPRNGPYLVEAGSVFEGARGRYTLRLETDGAGATTDAFSAPVVSGEDVVMGPLPADTLPGPGTGVGYETTTFLEDTVHYLVTRIDVAEVLAGELARVDWQDPETGGFFDRWSYQAWAGETVTFRMEGKYLTPELRVGWWRDEVWEPLGTLEESPASLTSAVTVTFPADGQYEVQTRARFPGDLGPYTLVIERQ